MAMIKEFYKELVRRLSVYTTTIRNMYYSMSDQLIKLAMKVNYDPSKPFTFDSYTKRIATKADAIIKDFTSKIERTVANAMKIEQKMADSDAGKIAASVIGSSKAKENYAALFKEKPKITTQALSAPLGTSATVATTGGLKLSDRVWNLAGQAKSEIEMIINKGLAEGMSADRMSRLVKQYLNEPDRLFRRVRNEKGELILSDEAKKYHPGRGVYRSSYKNAMRLARTEINRAYHAQEHKRWQQMDFIVGFRVELSGSHPAEDICDELAGDYPKEFKFTGWHPQCMCHTIALIKGEHAAVTGMPKNFLDWEKRNADRIADAERRGSLPYFLRDNLAYTYVVPNSIVGKTNSSGIMPTALYSDISGVTSLINAYKYMVKKIAPQVRRKAFNRMLEREKYNREGDVIFMENSKYNAAEKHTAIKLSKPDNGYYVVFPNNDQIKEIKKISGDYNNTKNDVILIDKTTFTASRTDLKSSGVSSIEGIAGHISYGSLQAPTIVVDIIGKISKTDIITAIRKGWTKDAKKVLLNYKGQWYDIDYHKAFDRKGQWLIDNLK